MLKVDGVKEDDEQCHDNGGIWDLDNLVVVDSGRRIRIRYWTINSIGFVCFMVCRGFCNIYFLVLIWTFAYI